MEMNIDTAKEIAKLLEESSALCNESLEAVKTNEVLGIIQVYGRLVGYFLGHSYTNLLAPIWKTYPELEPPTMKAPYSEPIPELSEESKSAISAFLAQASKTLTRVKEILESQSQPVSLPFGGLKEVEKAVTDIQEFLENPRFRDEKPNP